jgi:hypothetical protein
MIIRETLFILSPSCPRVCRREAGRRATKILETMLTTGYILRPTAGYCQFNIAKQDLVSTLLCVMIVALGHGPPVPGPNHWI